MRFDRWRYDAELNRFENHPVIASVSDPRDAVWIKTVQAAVICTLVRRIETRWQQAFELMQRRIEGGE